MKKYLTWLLLPTALVVVLALLIAMKKLPSNFWAVTWQAKWLAIKNFLSDPTANVLEKDKRTPATTPTTTPATSRTTRT